VAVVAVAVLALVVGPWRVRRDVSPSHCYGRYLSTLKSRQDELEQHRPEPQMRPWPVRYVFAPIRTAASWIAWYVRYRFRPKHDMVALDATTGSGVDALRKGADGSTRVAITGDWANGGKGSEAVATEIGRVDPHVTIHLGDIYSVGAEHEVEKNFLGNGTNGVAWPVGEFGALAVPGNHEYYSGAAAFYDIAMERHLGLRGANGARHAQAATYFCLQNEHWSLIGIDTAYHSVKWAGLEGVVRLINKVPILKTTRWAQSLKTKLPKEILAWLRVILADQSRAIILLSHHQDITTLDRRGSHPKPREQISRLLQGRRRILWLCGHGHRLEIHDDSADEQHAPNVTVLSRTVGHGAETDVVDNAAAIAARSPLLQLADNRGLPGFAVLRLTDEHLAIDYNTVDPTKDPSTPLEPDFQEEFRSADGNVEGPFNVKPPPGDGFVGSLTR
jgi:hypothetical protein